MTICEFSRPERHGKNNDLRTKGGRWHAAGSGGRTHLDSVRVHHCLVDSTDAKALESPHVRFDGAGATTLEHVDAEVVVIAVPAHEPHHMSSLGHQVHAHRLVKRLAPVEVADVEMHMAEDGAA